MVLCLCFGKPSLLSIYSSAVKKSIRFCAFQMNLNRLLQTYLHSLSGFRNTGGNILFIQRKNTIDFFCFSVCIFTVQRTSVQVLLAIIVTIFL